MTANRLFRGIGRTPRGTRECPPGYVAIWAGPARTGARCLVHEAELHRGPVPTFGRTVENRTGQPVRVADRRQVITTMAASAGLVELSDSRALTLYQVLDPADSVGEPASAYPDPERGVDVPGLHRNVD